MDSKFVLAPVRGITDSIYRNAFMRHFGLFDSAIAPFFTASSQSNADKKLLRDFQPEKDLLPTVPQILSKDPKEFLELAQVFLNLGYCEINWNLGCPHPVVVSKNKGSGLLPHPDLIDHFLEKVFQTFKGKISIKMRLGYESSEEILSIIPILNRYPISEITIHARTGKQMYRGFPDLEAFENCIPLISHSLVYNGDINSIQKFKELSNRFPKISKWMIGRGVFKNPYLIWELKGKSPGAKQAQLKKLSQFHDELYQGYIGILSGDRHILDRMIAHWEYLSEYFPDGQRLFRKIKKFQKPSQYLDFVKNILI